MKERGGHHTRHLCDPKTKVLFALTWRASLYTIGSTSINTVSSTTSLRRLRFAEHISSTLVAGDIFAQEDTHTQIFHPNSGVSVIGYGVAAGEIGKRN